MVSASGPWFAKAGAAVESARPVLFCLPHAGGGASAFRGWADALAPEVEALPVYLPGRERRIGEPAVIDASVIAAAAATALKARGRPGYAFYGHSLGGWLAFEVIKELTVLSVPPPVRLYVGAARPPHLGLLPELRGIAAAPAAELGERLLALGGIPERLFDYPDLVDVVLRVMRADFGWLESYSYEPQPPLAVPIVAFAATDDGLASESDMVGWDRHTSAGMTLRRVNGSHLFAQELCDELTTYIKADLLAGASSPHPAGS